MTVRSRGVSGRSVSVAAWFAVGAAAIVFADGGVGTDPARSPRVLVIQSYHPGYAWGDRILEGVQAVLASRTVDLSVEYLDSQRNAGPAYEAALDALLDAKYAHDPAPALVIACDDPALDFVLARRSTLLQDAPVVFCGVNGYDDARLAGQRDITGVVEAADFRGTIRLALQLGPGVRRVYALGLGTSPTREANLARLRALKGEFGAQLDLDTLANLTWLEVPGAIAALPPDSALLVYYHLTDEHGHARPIAETTRLLNTHAKGPVYTCWDFTVEDGALGGRVVSGLEQGRAAGELALRVLDGEPAGSIPVKRESPNVDMFNDAQLRRFGLRTRDLPRGAVVVGRPASFYREHWDWFWILGGGLLVQGVLIAVLVVNRGRLRRAQRAVGESEEKYRLLAEQSNDGITIVQDERVRYANQSLAALMGRDARELIDHPYRDFVAPGSISEANAIYAEQMSGEARQGIYESKIQHRDGRVIDIEINACNIQYEGRKAILATIRDISQRRRDEEQRRLLEARVERAQRLESLGVLAGGIAHDFNNLLVGIMGHAELAADHAPPDPLLRASLAAIETAAKRAAELTRQMLAYAGRGRLMVEPVDLNLIVRETLELLRSTIARAVGIHLELEEGLPPILADAPQIRQVVLNLLTNASEAIGVNPGTITVRSCVRECDRAALRSMYFDDDLPPGRYLVLSVADTGCGMDEATKLRIFEPFFTTKFTGRGLGLAATVGIVRGHRGAMQVASAKDAGTTFWVYFPVAAQPTAVVAHDGESHDARRKDAPQCATVLLVDDEDIVRDACARTLQHLGMSVVVAESGPQALEILRQRGGEIDCVLLDLIMPEMDGRETLAALRAIRADLPVVVVSGVSDAEVTDRLGPLRIDGVIQKPYRIDDVRTVLGRVLK